MSKEGPNNFYDEVPQAEIGAVGDGSGHETEFIDLSQPSAETMSAWQGTVDKDPGVPSSDDVMVGENLVRPSTAGRSEHIDLPLGELPPVNSDIYNKMVDRPGFPPVSQEVDLELP